MIKEITLIDKYIAGKVAYNLWRCRDALFVFEKNKLYEKLESLSKEPALNIGTKWFETGLTKIKYGELVDNDCKLSIFYDYQKIKVLFKGNIPGVNTTITFDVIG